MLGGDSGEVAGDTEGISSDSSLWRSGITVIGSWYSHWRQRIVSWLSPCVFKTRKVSFIEFCTFAYDYAFGDRAIKLPCLETIWVANKNAIFHM